MKLPTKPSGINPIEGKAEPRWVFGFAALVMTITTIPYIIGYVNLGSGFGFTGFVFAIEDGNSYIAKMLSGAYGAWLFRTPYTAISQKGVLMFLPYILLGKLAASPGMHEQLVALYHLFRIAAGIMAIKATYDFLAFFLNDVQLRRLGLALSVLGGGLGWIFVLIGRQYTFDSLPLEFYSPETFGFLGLFGFPHLSAARALMLWTLLAYLQRLDSGEADEPLIKPAARMGLLWLLAGLMQPLTTILIGFVIGLHFLAVGKLWRRKLGASDAASRTKRLFLFLLVAAIGPLLYLFYQAFSVLSDPFLAQWSAQNIIRSPHPLHYLFAYGIILPFSILGGVRLAKIKPEVGSLVILWVMALPILAYAPVNLQRRLPEGVWVALVVLAVIALEAIQKSSKIPGGLKKWMSSSFFLAFPSTIFLVVGGFLGVMQPSEPLFRPSEEIAVFKTIREQVEPGAVILSSYETGNALPAWAPVRVVIGHGPESAGLAEIEPLVEAFFTKEFSTIQRLELIRKYGVTHLFYGPHEVLLGEWKPEEEIFLERIFQAGDFAFYRVLVDGAAK